MKYHLFNIYTWISTLNLLCLFLLLPNMPWSRWFFGLTRKFDGHAIGRFIQRYAVAYFMAGIVLMFVLWDWSYNSLGPAAAKVSIAFCAIMSFIPWLLGREIYKGKKIFTEDIR